MSVKKMGRTGSPPFLRLEDSHGFAGDLGVVKTGTKYRKEMIDTIKNNLSYWMANSDFGQIRGEQLDLAIVVKLSPQRLKTQDVDNIAKVICDALKRRRGDKRFLFDNDCQIVRMLVLKIQRRENPQWDTDSYDISFRVHDGNRPMNLIEDKRI